MLITSTILCLALNVFYEARNTTEIDREAVAVVALNRAQEEKTTVCHVIAEPKQFSWTSKYRMRVPKLRNIVDRKAWEHSLAVARLVLSSKPIQQRFARVFYYHAHYVRPFWDRRMRIAFSTPYQTYYRS
jgi:N-acetylmuramoyl-L-alanine amidase